MRVEQLIDTIGLTSSIPVGEADPLPTVAALQRLDHIAHRLRKIAAEVDTRAGVSEWDVGDTVLSRLLLSDTADALRACRTVTTAAGARLAEVHAALRDGRRVLEREAERRTAPQDADGR